MNIKLILAALILAAHTVSAHAAPSVNCGDTLTRDTTLTSDLNCSSGWFALNIGVNGITLDLNGHTITGTDDLIGIEIYDKKNVTVKNGSLRGFWTGIRATDNNRLSVKDLLFYKTGQGMTSFRNQRSIIENNQFVKNRAFAITVRGDALQPSTGNRIINNEVYAGDTGIQLCGQHTYKNSIIDNLITKTKTAGISIRSSDRNRVQGNVVYNSDSIAISLAQSSYNKITNNSFRIGEYGMQLLGLAGDLCSDDPSKKSIKNIISYNHFFEFKTGVVLGLSSFASPDVEYNQLYQNKVYDDEIGIRFNNTTYKNDVNGNTYIGTVTPVIDSGVSNTY